MTPQSQPEEEVQFIKIYLLAHLTEEERTAYLSKLQGGIESEGLGGSVKPQLVDWPPEQAGDGSVEGGDLLRLYKAHPATTADEPADADGAALFQYFADRQSIDTDTVIQADRDYHTLLFSPQTAQVITKLAQDNGIRAVSREAPGEEGWWCDAEAVADRLVGDLLRRGVAWGRIPAGELWSSWCNLDIGKMGGSELIEIYGGSVGVARDPGWDESGFVEKMREEVKRMREESP